MEVNLKKIKNIRAPRAHVWGVVINHEAAAARLSWAGKAEARGDVQGCLRVRRLQNQEAQASPAAVRAGTARVPTTTSGASSHATAAAWTME